LRYKLKKDEHHAQIAHELGVAGFSVADTSRVGASFPDMAIARNGVCALLEIKTPRGLKTALERRSAGQIEFHTMWKGPIITAYNASEIIHEFNQLLKRTAAWSIK
jgi:hypothetical protein